MTIFGSVSVAYREWLRKRSVARVTLDCWDAHTHEGEPRLKVLTLGRLKWGPPMLAIMLAHIGEMKRARKVLGNAELCGRYGADHPRALAWYDIAHASIEAYGR